MPQRDLKTAWKAIQKKKKAYTRYFNYYDGDQPVSYTHKRLEEFLKGFQMRFNANWCSTVVDQTLNKVRLQGLQLADEQAAERFAELWRLNELEIESRLVHECALLTGEAMLIIWPEEDENGTQPAAYFNDSRWCHVEYDGDRPRRKSWAAKLWEDSEGNLCATLYYRDHLEYYATNKETDKVSSVSSFRPAEQPTAPNPYDEIPVFHFRVHHRRPKSELKNILPLQDAINKLAADLLVSAEYNAFAQRWLIAHAEGLGQLEDKPNGIWRIPPAPEGEQGVEVGEFSQTDLTNYLEAIKNFVAQVGSISQTPRHYFLTTTQSQPSGEALLSQEAPLNAKCGDRIEAFTPSWRRALRFLLLVSGEEDLVDDEAIKPMFTPPETVQPVTEAQVVKTYTEAGVPLELVLERQGWSEEELMRLEELLQEKEKQRRETLAEMQARAQAEFEQGVRDEDLAE